MDKFDQSITEANQTKTIEPSAHFVDRTIDKVKRLPKRAKLGWGIKAWGRSIAGLVAILAVVFVIAPLTQNSSSQLNSNNAAKTKSSSSSQSSTKAPTTTATTSTSTTPAAATSGTDDASLNNDLSAVSASINQENTDQSAANNGINDSAQEITVPTN